MLKHIKLILGDEADTDEINYTLSEENITKDDSLIITDNEAVLSELKKNGFAVLFYSRDNKFMEGAEYVTDSVEDCDRKYMELVFAREKGLPLTILETKRTIVREMTVEDLPLLYELYDDEEIKKYIEPLYPYEEEKEFTESYIRNMYGFYGFGLWLVFNKENNELIGRAGISIRNIDGEDKHEMGYIIGKKYRRQGYAYEVCSAIKNYAFSEIKMEDLFIVTEKRNLPSCDLADKLGFTVSGLSEVNGCEYMIFQCKE